MNVVKNFALDEDGAVTVDWVVLTAAVVGLGVAAVATVGDSIKGLSTKISTAVGDVDATAPADAE